MNTRTASHKLVHSRHLIANEEVSAPARKTKPPLRPPTPHRSELAVNKLLPVVSPDPRDPPVTICIFANEGPVPREVLRFTLDRAIGPLRTYGAEELRRMRESLLATVALIDEATSSSRGGPER